MGKGEEGMGEEEEGEGRNESNVTMTENVDKKIKRVIIMGRGENR
jgi:hypothetical protein